MRALGQGDQEWVVAVFLGGLFDALNQIDDLGAVATLLLLDELDRVCSSIFTNSETLLQLVDADMLLHQLVGLLLKCLIDIDLFRVGVANNGVDRGEGRVSLDERPQKRIGRDDLVEHLDFFVLLEKLLAPVLGRGSAR